MITVLCFFILFVFLDSVGSWADQTTNAADASSMFSLKSSPFQLLRHNIIFFKASELIKANVSEHQKPCRSQSSTVSKVLKDAMLNVICDCSNSPPPHHHNHHHNYWHHHHWPHLWKTVLTEQKEGILCWPGCVRKITLSHTHYTTPASSSLFL